VSDALDRPAPTDQPPDSPAPEPGAPAETPAPDAPASPTGPSPDSLPGHRPSGSISKAAPTYKGAPLDEERGPGLGCFWFQAIVLGVLLVLTPLTVVWAWDPAISAALLIITLVLLLFTGNTVIFLLRLVAADRRTRRRPLNESARKTVGQLEEEAAAQPPTTPPTPPTDAPAP
jgi:hypothetical protein